LDCINLNKETASQRRCKETPVLFLLDFDQNKDISNGDWAVSLGMHLHNYYNQSGLIEQVHARDMYAYEQARSDNNVVFWTACFTCPITGIEINSGTIKFDYRAAFSDWKKTNDELKILKQDGKVYYESKKIAN